MITVIPEQSLLDIAVHDNGNVLAAFETAFANGLSITAELFPGQKLVAPSSINRNAEVANYFKGKKQMIATGFNIADGQSIIPTLGIGTMRVGTTFIVG
ncbi:MAG: hypothetical protein Q8R22_02970 [Flavobacterium sp.]|uniref:hypothetical protein n=1 Tax=Flavobacterium sp. TaxID=239 RepID=UPI002733B703|nr:hypothetical protein [Flavobacterium sp.]MDP3679780.1 hypothetical protein [Flavobacterium sp.]MDZ4331622.1 hypothetical protein [Flavobacterium sp.]